MELGHGRPVSFIRYAYISKRIAYYRRFALAGSYPVELDPESRLNAALVPRQNVKRFLIFIDIRTGNNKLDPRTVKISYATNRYARNP